MENNFTNIKDRVVQVAEAQDMSKEAFFKSIGMTSASFRGKAKGTPLNSNAIVNIISKYPETDLYWLLHGTSKDVNMVEEAAESYDQLCQRCLEKDKLIAVLEEQIVDLKADKNDFKKLLGLQK